MADSLSAFWKAVETFADRLSGVDWQFLALGLGFHLLNMLLRTRAWRNILQAAAPRTTVRWPGVFRAYMAGVGVNGVAPARAGDVVKLYLVHHQNPRIAYPTVGSSLVVETLFDMPTAFLLLLWAYFAGKVPGLPDLPGLSAFEWSFLARHPEATVIGLGIFAMAVATTIILMGRRIRAFWDRVADGFAIIRRPRLYGRYVALLQGAGWICRGASAWFFLEAFHVPATVETALLVLVIQGAATALPITPGGIGPKQAFAAIVLAEYASQPDILAFSVGMEAAILVFNLAVGAVCMAQILGGWNFKEAIRSGREAQAAARVGTETPSEVDPFHDRRSRG